MTFAQVRQQAPQNRKELVGERFDLKAILVFDGKLDNCYDAKNDVGQDPALRRGKM